jgi:hypothetical protein
MKTIAEKTDRFVIEAGKACTTGDLDAALILMYRIRTIIDGHVADQADS